MLTMTEPGNRISKSVCVNPSGGCTAPPTEYPDDSLDTRSETFVQKIRPYRERHVTGDPIPIRIPADYGTTVGFGPGESRSPDGYLMREWGEYEFDRTLPGCAHNRGAGTRECFAWIVKPRRVLAVVNYIDLQQQQGYLDGWTISRFGRGSYDEDGTHWGAYEAPVHGFRKDVPACGTLAEARGGDCWYYTPGSNKEKRRIPVHNAKGYQEYSTWGLLRYETRYRTTENVRRWFIAAKHDGGDGYRAFGYWTSVKFTQGHPSLNSENWRSGLNITVDIFAGGTDPATDVSRVVGSATYRGEAAGAIYFQDETARLATFEGARTDLTANFDSMKINGRVYLQGENKGPEGWNTHVRDSLQEADGYVGSRLGGSLAHLRTVLPENLTLSADITDGGRLTNGTTGPREFGPASSFVSTATPPHFNGQFHQPDGNNAPGSVMGTFSYTAGQNEARIQIKGAFGAEKQ